jgi:hypothetical protein
MKVDKMKVSFEMNEEDFDNLVSILHEYVVKHKFDIQTDSTYSKEEKEWHTKHADYVQYEIVDKIIRGIQK